MLSLAFIRQFISRYWPSLLLLFPHLRYQLQKTEINGHSHTGTFDQLEKTFFRGQSGTLRDTRVINKKALWNTASAGFSSALTNLFAVCNSFARTASLA